MTSKTKTPEQSYKDKYGEPLGRTIYHLKQTNAANARWKAYYRDKARALHSTTTAAAYGVRAVGAAD